MVLKHVAMLAAGVAAAGGALALWNAVLSELAKRRLRVGVRMVEAPLPEGGKVKMAVYEAGEGEYTVVLDAGLGMSALSWSWVMEEVAKKSRVIAFDRPGLGASPPPPKGKGWLRRVDDIVEGNRAVLKAMGVKDHLILVGHSTSGMHVRLHTLLHPSEVAGAVLIDTAHEGQLDHLEGSSVYNSYPPAHVTDAKLSKLHLLWHTGMFRVMRFCSGQAFWNACTWFPPLFLTLRLLDYLGRAAAKGVLQNEKILGPHFSPENRQRFTDEQFSLEGMGGMIAEHGSQRASMEYMLSLQAMRPRKMGTLPLLIISRDPKKGAAGGLYPNARGDPAREGQHQSFQMEQVALSEAGRRVVVQGAGHGSLLFVKQHAVETAKGILEVVEEARGRRMGR